MVGCTALTVAEYLGIDSRIGLLNSRWLKTSKKYGQKSDYRRLAPTDFLSVFDILANSLLSAVMRAESACTAQVGVASPRKSISGGLP